MVKFNQHSFLLSSFKYYFKKTSIAINNFLSSLVIHILICWEEGTFTITVWGTKWQRNNHNYISIGNSSRYKHKCFKITRKMNLICFFKIFPVPLLVSNLISKHCILTEVSIWSDLILVSPVKYMNDTW